MIVFSFLTDKTYCRSLFCYDSNVVLNALKPREMIHFAIQVASAFCYLGDLGVVVSQSMQQQEKSTCVVGAYFKKGWLLIK